ncbi:YadA-like family protein, partial [Luteimonas terrae]
IGSFSVASGVNSVAVGGGAGLFNLFPTEASGDYSTAIGGAAWASGFNSTAVGNFSTAAGDDSLALGSDATATAEGSVALGQGSEADRANSVSVGSVGNERQITNVAAGELSADSTDAVNGGQLAETNTRVDGVEDRLGDVEDVAANAISYDDDNRSTLTFDGEDGTRLTNLANGSISAGSTDAVTGGQVYGGLQSAADALGGGAAVTAFGTISAPTYAIQGGNYYSVGDAFGALDAEISGLKQQVGTLDAAVNSANAGKADMSVATAATAEEASATDSNARRATSATAGTEVAAGGDETAATGTAEQRSAAATTGAAAQDGIASAQAEAPVEGADTGARSTGVQGTPTAASAGRERVSDTTSVTASATQAAGDLPASGGVTMAQVEAASAEARAYADTTATQAVTSANTYTDQRFAAFNDTFESFKGDVDRRFYDTDRRIDRQGAMGAAMLNMATSAAGIRTQNRVGVGVGFQGGESALSLGYQRAISERATVTFGGALSGDEKSVGVGAGFGW